MPARVSEKNEWLQGAIWSRETWLDDHGTKWPSTDVDTKRYGLEIMRDILSDYERSVEAAKKRQEQE